MVFGKLTEMMLMFAYAYVRPINVAFGTRDVIFWHLGIPGIPFSML